MKLNKIFKNFIIGLFFGLKKADNEFLNQSGDNSNKMSGVEIKLKTQNLGEAMLNQEVTQEVEELRWKNYRVVRESEKYKFNKDNSSISYHDDLIDDTIRQENYPIIQSVNDSIKSNKLEINEEWTVNFKYKDLPQFKIEKYLKFIILNKKEKVIKLIFNNYRNLNDSTSLSFLNRLKKYSLVKDNKQFNQLNVFNNIDEISFITDKAEGQLMGFKYRIYLDDINISNFKYFEDGKTITIEIKILDFTEIDLFEKYKSLSMEEKYKNKEKKSKMIYTLNTIQHKCALCGKPISEYDANISKLEFGKEICQECMLKEIIENENSN